MAGRYCVLSCMSYNLSQAGRLLCDPLISVLFRQVVNRFRGVFAFKARYSGTFPLSISGYAHPSGNVARSNIGYFLYLFALKQADKRPQYDLFSQVLQLNDRFHKARYRKSNKLPNQINISAHFRPHTTRKNL